MDFIKEYIEKSTDILHRILPNENRDDIKSFVKKKVNKKLIDPTVNLDNNVTGENRDTKLSNLITWLEKKKPVISGNATFYMQPTELLSPTANMLRSLKKLRKTIKSEMFKYNPGDDEYGNLDLDQSNTKVIMNAEYGGSGTKSAAFYTRWSPPATTLLAQSIITTMANLFESIVGDNNKFMSIQECFDWILCVFEKESLNDDLPKWIKIPNKELLKQRIKNHFYIYDIRDDFIINKYIESLNDKETVYLYYAHNLHDFIKDHDNVGKLIRNILSTLPTSPYSASIPEAYSDKFEDISKYNEYLQDEMFMNPHHIPEPIKIDIVKLNTLLFKFCHVSYLTPDSIEKLNHHKRNTVLLVDTDSNVIYLDPFVKFIKNEICGGNNFGRKDIYNDLIIVNMMANFLDMLAKDILELYGIKHNMDESSRAELTMKNEFLFRTLMLLTAKKSYLASIVLREGHLFDPFKTEIKGVQFIKSAVSEIVSERFTKITEDNILFSEEVNLKGLMRDLRQFEYEIIKDLREGGTKYLKAQGLKADDAYKDPWIIQIYKATNAWNIIYPENKIYPLDRSFIVKLGVKSLVDIERIQHKHPDIYETIKSKIFNSHDSNVSKYGLQVIAVPATEDKVPEWIRELMDIDLLCSDVMNSFRMIMDAFRTEYIKVDTPTKKIQKFTNFIRF